MTFTLPSLANTTLALGASAQLALSGPIVQAAAPAETGRVDALKQIIRPNVRERWSGLILRGLTPERVDAILRCALSGDIISQWELFDLMEETWPRLRSHLHDVKAAVQCTDFHVEPYKAKDEKEPSEKAKAKAARLHAAMLACQPDVTRDENSFEGALYDLGDAFAKGLCVQEIHWTRGAVDGQAAILPRAFRWVHPRYYGFSWTQGEDGDDRLMLCRDGNQSTWEDFPADKFIIGRFKTKTGHLLGGALLRSLATFWIGANFSYDWALNLAQMFGIPIRWATYEPGNVKLLDDIAEMLENLGSAGWGAFPAGTTLELKEAIQRAADNPQAFVMQLADTAADILILGSTLTSDAGTHGTQALGTVHKSVRDERLDFIARWAAETLNYQFVAPLMRLNFGDNEEDPWLCAQSRMAKDEKAIAERAKIVVKDMGLPVPAQWLYEYLGIPMPVDGEPVYVAAPAPVPPANDPNTLPDPTKAKAPAIVLAKSANDQLADRVMENLTGVQAKWLAGIKPVFADLVAKAKDGSLSDADFIAALQRASDTFPELVSLLDTASLARSMEEAMAPALVNGVARGVIDRAKAAKRKGDA